MTKSKLITAVCRAIGLKVPTKYLPGRVITLTADEVTHLRAAYAQDGR